MIDLRSCRKTHKTYQEFNTNLKKKDLEPYLIQKLKKNLIITIKLKLQKGP